MAKHNTCPECQQSSDNVSPTRDTREQSYTLQQRPASPPPLLSLQPSSTIVNPFYTGRPRTPAHGSKHTPIDRQEIIRRIKSGGSRPTSPELERPVSRTSLLRANGKPTSAAEAPGKPDEAAAKTTEAQLDNAAIGQEIERPRSALHRGDFREKECTSSAFDRFGEPATDEPAPSLSTSPVAPWHSDFPAAALRRRQEPSTAYEAPNVYRARSRALSHASFALSFAYKPPTSPLVQASRPDTPEPGSRRSSRSPDKSRRHTFSPNTLQRFSSALGYPSTARQPPALRSERTYPYQAHQPRRSLNSSASLPQTPLPRSRRPSVPDSPLHHATMVGSYEESILRGRMSTTPSKPLNFVAQIGVLGKGDCKSSLRCPPHAIVPFPAVFYSYAATSRVTESTDQPSPYVGLIDLENNLPAAVPSPEKRRQRLRAARDEEGGRVSSPSREENSASDAQARRRRRQKQKRRSGSPKAPPGGSYRIPQQGQLQIVIKNPNKTAVKLFLVPYDLSDMEPGQKTFIRQRSYSAGPIIDLPPTSRASPAKEAGVSSTDVKGYEERPMLRYLVHLHICCPSEGRFFLYKSVRVVFANRVPDGKERLRNEIQLPEPKYSTYKPGRDSNVGTTPDLAARRRSAVEVNPFDGQDSAALSPYRTFFAQSLPLTEHIPPPPMPKLDFSKHVLTPLESRPASRQLNEDTNMESPQPFESASNYRRTPGSSLQHHSLNGLNGAPKLDEPFEFDRDSGRDWKAGTQNESLLSMRLKGSTHLDGSEG